MSHKLAPGKAVITNRGIISGDDPDPSIAVADFVPNIFKGTPAEAKKQADAAFKAHTKKGRIVKATAVAVVEDEPEPEPDPVTPAPPVIPPPPVAPAAAKGGATAKD